MIPIYVPSRDRAHQFNSTFNPVRQMPMKLRQNTTYVLHDMDLELYSLDAPAGIKLVTSPVTGISAVRRWIGEQAHKAKQKYFMMCDDDVKWYRREDNESVKLIASNPQDVKDMVDLVEACLDAGYAHVGVSAREGNNNIGPCDQNHIDENTRTLRVLAYNTEAFLDCEHGRVPVMEDFDINLQLLSKGLPNCNLVWYCQDQSGTQARGGCSTYRSLEVHNSTAERMAELWPGIAKLREKKNKTGGEFGHRKEVTIQWKKAYATPNK